MGPSWPPSPCKTSESGSGPEGSQGCPDPRGQCSCCCSLGGCRKRGWALGSLTFSPLMPASLGSPASPCRTPCAVTHPAPTQSQGGRGAPPARERRTQPHVLTGSPGCSGAGASTPSSPSVGPRSSAARTRESQDRQESPCEGRERARLRGATGAAHRAGGWDGGMDTHLLPFYPVDAGISLGRKQRSWARCCQRGLDGCSVSSCSGWG